jgi:hypothetical protein
MVGKLMPEINFGHLRLDYLNSDQPSLKGIADAAPALVCGFHVNCYTRFGAGNKYSPHARIPSGDTSRPQLFSIWFEPGKR